MTTFRRIREKTKVWFRRITGVGRQRSALGGSDDQAGEDGETWTPVTKAKDGEASPCIGGDGLTAITPPVTSESAGQRNPTEGHTPVGIRSDYTTPTTSSPENNRDLEHEDFEGVSLVNSSGLPIHPSPGSSDTSIHLAGAQAPVEYIQHSSSPHTLHDPPRGTSHSRHHDIQQEALSPPQAAPYPKLSHKGPASYFSHASSFNVGQLNTGNVNNFGLPQTVFDHLKPYISHGAAHNSNERSDAPICDPETRRAVQEDIVGWIMDGDGDENPKQMMWLSGPAGSGKTAIAGSVAETCKEAGLLAGSFFFSSFSGSSDRCSKRGVVATLAHHLSGHDALHEYKRHLLVAIERNPDIFYKRLKEQAQCLILQPLRMNHEQVDIATWPKGVIIDGLDEVLGERSNAPLDDRPSHEDDQIEILDVLITLAKDPALPFRIFVSSRPERVIHEFFSTTAESATVKLFLDSKYDPDTDIHRFLHSKFASIRRRYGILDASWPGQEAIDRIVEMSSGQFIVPATIVRHINAGVPQRQLDDIMKLKWEKTGRRNPFAVLDALYTCILRRSPEPLLAAKWIRVYMSAKRELTALYFKRLVEDVEGEFNHVFGPLSSLISIPAAGHDDAPLKFYHKTLTDFLSSTHRSGDLYFDGSSLENFVADRCVSVLKGKGPAVPIQHSPLSNGCGFFLDEFYQTTLINLLSMNSREPYVVYSRDRAPFPLLSQSFALTLSRLSEESKAELAVCDVAWWTRLCLAHQPYQTHYFGEAFIKGMYCGIHAHICNASLRKSAGCHAACVRWRTGIIAEAKALGWCAHELEHIRVRELANLTQETFDYKFKKMGKQRDGSFLCCAICQPEFTTS